MNSAQVFIQQEASARNMRLGDTMRLRCPWCESQEDSLTTTRTQMGLLYKCHRASCNHQGFVPTAGWILPIADKDSPIERSLRPYTGELFPLCQASQEFFRERYELSQVISSEFIQETAQGEYALPLLDILGHVTGYNIRQPWRHAPLNGVPGRPKALIYMHSHSPTYSAYYRDGSRKPLILVEDQLSAIKVYASGVANAVALCGVHLDAARVRAISQIMPPEVIIALDEDATSYAFLAAKRFGLAFRKIRVAMLGKDLKDTPMNDFREILGINE